MMPSAWSKTEAGVAVAPRPRARAGTPQPTACPQIGGIESADQVLTAEITRVVADDLGEQGFLGDRAAAGVLCPDPGPVIDSFPGRVLACRYDEARDIFQSQVVVTGRGQGESAVNCQPEVRDARE